MRQMQDLTKMTIRDIAVAYPATTRIFEEYKIDYCCGGGKRLSEACEHADIAIEDLERRLTAVLSDPVDSPEPERFGVPELVGYILDKHHVFTRNEMLRLNGLLEKVVWKHGERHPELIMLKQSFAALSDDLLVHMRKEEMVLFPYINDLHRSRQRNTIPLMPPFGTVLHPIRMMQYEHDEAGEILRDIRAMTGDYTIPDDACPTFRALYAGLQDLELDLHRHIHLENNVLFPKVIELEQQVFAVN
jgi:regulator of cell morphogenesis and NO signaling